MAYDSAAYMREKRKDPLFRAKERARMSEYLARPDIKEKRKKHRQIPEVKEKLRGYHRLYMKKHPLSPEAKKQHYENAYHRIGMAKIQTEYKTLMLEYGERNGDLPLYRVIRLEALCEFLGRDLEEWRLGKDKDRYNAMRAGGLNGREAGRRSRER